MRNYICALSGNANPANRLNIQTQLENVVSKHDLLRRPDDSGLLVTEQQDPLRESSSSRRHFQTTRMHCEFN